MTLIVTALIGDYALIAADSKQSYHYNTNLQRTIASVHPPTDSRITNANGSFFVGSGNTDVLADLNFHFSKTATITPEKLFDFDSNLKVVESISDFDRLHYITLLRTSSGDFVDVSYVQTSDTDHIIYKFETLTPVDYNFVVIPPMDLDGEYLNEGLEYYIKRMPEINDFHIIEAVTEFYRVAKNLSDYISSGFHLILLHKSKPDIIKFIPN